jgi:threonine dehydrogenase-like Zn-dependent dehydrogenase
MVQVMARLNASVRVIGQASKKLALCERWGVKHRHVDDIGRRADQDIVVDCTGSASGLDLAMKLVRPRGTIVLKSLLPPDERVDLTPAVLNELTLLGSHAGPIGEAVALLERDEVDVVSLISRRVNLEDAPSALGDDGEAIKVLVTI